MFIIGMMVKTEISGKRCRLEQKSFFSLSHSPRHSWFFGCEYTETLSDKDKSHDFDANSVSVMTLELEKRVRGDIHLLLEENGRHGPAIQVDIFARPLKHWSQTFVACFGRCGSDGGDAFNSVCWNLATLKKTLKRLYKILHPDKHMQQKLPHYANEWAVHLSQIKEFISSVESNARLSRYWNTHVRNLNRVYNARHCTPTPTPTPEGTTPNGYDLDKTQADIVKMRQESRNADLAYKAKLQDMEKRTTPLNFQALRNTIDGMIRNFTFNSNVSAAGRESKKGKPRTRTDFGEERDDKKKKRKRQRKRKPSEGLDHKKKRKSQPKSNSSTFSQGTSHIPPLAIASSLLIVTPVLVSHSLLNDDPNPDSNSDSVSVYRVKETAFLMTRAESQSQSPSARTLHSSRTGRTLFFRRIRTYLRQRPCKWFHRSTVVNGLKHADMAKKLGTKKTLTQILVPCETSPFSCKATRSQQTQNSMRNSTRATCTKSFAHPPHSENPVSDPVDPVNGFELLGILNTELRKVTELNTVRLKIADELLKDLCRGMKSSSQGLILTMRPSTRWILAWIPLH